MNLPDPSYSLSFLSCLVKGGDVLSQKAKRSSIKVGPTKYGTVPNNYTQDEKCHNNVYDDNKSSKY